MWFVWNPYDVHQWINLSCLKKSISTATRQEDEEKGTDPQDAALCGLLVFVRKCRRTEGILNIWFNLSEVCGLFMLFIFKLLPIMY